MPGLILTRDYPQPRLGMGALRVGLSAVYKVGSHRTHLPCLANHDNSTGSYRASDAVHSNRQAAQGDVSVCG